MKNKKLLLIGSLVTISLVTVSFFNPFAKLTSVYKPRQSEEPAKTNADAAMEYYKSLRLNPATGLYDVGWLRQVRDQVIAEIAMQQRASTLTWMEEGPDNVGGRTRATCIDRNDANHVFAGSVSGGLFVSTNAGNNWTLVPGFNEYLRISTMCQTLDGTYYVGTGCSFDNWNGEGEGIFTSTDGGVTWSLVPGSTTFTNVNELQSDPIVADKIWIAGSSASGLKTYTPSGGFVSAPGLTGNFQDVKISPDGTTIVCGKSSSGIQTFVSTDSGNTFTDVSGTGTGEIPNLGRARMEYAISYDKNSDNKWTVYASASSSVGDCLKSVHVSEDNGMTWTEIAPEGSSNFDPYSNPGMGCQGTYDQITAAIPGQPDHVLVGGAPAVYKWKKSATASPVFGQWYQKSYGYASEFSPVYVHPDHHEMRWDQNDILYIGSDGGISKSFDKGENVFISHNRGYNCTQFYSVAFNRFGHTMGGTQDNGTQYKNYTGVTSLEYQEVMGGDGFDCDISHIIPETMFATVYFGDFRRSDDEGGSWEFFGPLNPTSNMPFNTVGRLYENKNDVNSTETVNYIADENMVAGDTVFYLSKTQQLPLEYILTAPLLDGDTIALQDPVQSIFAAGYAGNSGVYITREAMRFNVDPEWVQVIPSVSGTVYCIEFSADGNYMYVGTTTSLYIVKNLNSFYAPANDISNVTVTTIALGTQVLGIGVDPNDPDHVIIARGDDNVSECINATTATLATSFISVTGTLTNMPIYDCVIDYQNPNTFVIGTEFGPYVTDDGGANWEYQPAMGLVPVYSVRQQWRTSDCWNSGVVYLGTFGRGIWSTNSLVGINDPDATAVAHAEVTEINTYPNPMNSNGTISFKLKERNNVDIYVMDLTGKIVLTKNLGQQNAGKIRTEINVGDLSSGTYVVMIQAGKETGTDKLVVTH